MSNSTLYDSLVEVTEDYLGPAAKRFIDRQTQNHLHKKPGHLTTEEFIELSDWVKITIALLTKDEKIKNEYNKKLDNLINRNVSV